MNIFGHDGHSLGMDGTQVGVLGETHEIRLCLLLQSKDCMALETQATLHVHSDITTALKERKEKQGKIADRACVVNR